jgi:hypothetical protein
MCPGDAGMNKPGHVPEPGAHRGKTGGVQRPLLEVFVPTSNKAHHPYSPGARLLQLFSGSRADSVAFLETL